MIHGLHGTHNLEYGALWKRCASNTTNVLHASRNVSDTVSFVCPSVFAQMSNRLIVSNAIHNAVLNLENTLLASKRIQWDRTRVH